MSEEDVRGGLMDAVADEPPLRFDPDELVETARKQVRRRALVAAGFATVVIAVAAVAVPVALGRGTGTTPAAEQPVTQSSSPSPSTAPSGVVTADDLRQRGQEMTEHLRSTLPAMVPSASDFTYGEFGGEASGEFYAGQTSINAAISFTIDGKRYSIMITSWLAGSVGTPADTCVANCHQLPDQAGGALYEQTEDLGEGVIETLYHYRDTGAMVSVAAYNYDMASSTKPTYHPSLPVTRDQLVAIATAPELEL